MFGTTSTTSLSAFNYQEYYHPTMSSQVQQCNFFDDEDNEEEPQMVRGGSGQQKLRVKSHRRRKTPSCGASSHRRH
ncbi:hypothetical protein Lal_00023480 [Lupinus albus]|nr:hypothetical protein Lal_00023480 [Lupinus albus]